MDLATLRAKHTALSPVLTERSRRLWAATEAQAIGYGGIAQVAGATGYTSRICGPPCLEALPAISPRALLDLLDS